jgi:hypothetical protein
VDEVVRRVSDFTGAEGYEDDLTLIVVRVTEG